MNFCSVAELEDEVARFAESEKEHKRLIEVITLLLRLFVLDLVFVLVLSAACSRLSHGSTETNFMVSGSTFIVVLCRVFKSSFRRFSLKC